MTRQGFQQKDANESVWKYLGQRLNLSLQSLGPVMLVVFALYMLSVGVEWWWYGRRFVQLSESHAGKYLFLDNILFIFQALACLGIGYLLLQFLSSFWARLLLVISFTFIVVMQFILFLYFGESRNLLGADMFYYSSEEMKQILEASGMLSFTNIALLLLLIVIAWVPLWIANKQTFKKSYASIALLSLGIISFFISSASLLGGRAEKDEFVANASRSKWRYFFDSNLSNYVDEHPGMLAMFSKDDDDAKVLDTKFPFLKKEDTKDFLGTYMQKTAKVPNLVILVIEGLGHAYSAENGYIGNFTPFIGTLKQQSLYWDNNMSSSGRTFSVLPTITGSLPFATHGFLEQDTLPDNFNLFNILKSNGFNTGFFYGGHSNFDFMKKFMDYNKIDMLMDQAAFGPPYKKLPEKGGESWGYEDQAVFGKLLEVQKVQEHPYFHVLLTLSTHNPFLINNAAHYEQVFDQRIATLNLTPEQKKWALENRTQLVSVLNLDDAMEQFFKEYKKRPDFANTIFVITGDHAMPEIPLQSKIDRYHVPLLIYSPLLKGPKTFHNFVSHFDVAPSILAYYRENFGLKTPTQVTWIGQGLDKGASAQGDGIAMMQSKNQLIDFVKGSYHLSDGQLYKLDGVLNEDAAANNAKEELSKRFELFKRKNKLFYTQKRLLPDSVYTNYFSRTKKN
ncbi:LTA synthase family protein [Sphingobacterium sp. UGAL515B_05]|uniref:LTA synthase family protein n=1 Tax=Sphingobacterium sp. UGAL515B_05 TaxID=2986767 RepID=UPI0029529F1F|nr:LTA synthase family protein [Sphingobacterium sp. UGAL515B_05]WON93166.1 LTA synthase family protein [Sphingobacterium sp. UGAL515B_05]